MIEKKSDLIREAINLTIQGDQAPDRYIFLSDRAMEALSLLFRDYRMYKRSESLPDDPDDD